MEPNKDPLASLKKVQFQIQQNQAQIQQNLDQIRQNRGRSPASQNKIDPLASVKEIQAKIQQDLNRINEKQRNTRESGRSFSNQPPRRRGMTGGSPSNQDDRPGSKRSSSNQSQRGQKQQKLDKYNKKASFLKKQLHQLKDVETSHKMIDEQRQEVMDVLSRNEEEQNSISNSGIIAKQAHASMHQNQEASLKSTKEGLDNLSGHITEVNNNLKGILDIKKENLSQQNATQRELKKQLDEKLKYLDWVRDNEASLSSIQRASIQQLKKEVENLREMIESIKKNKEALAAKVDTSILSSIMGQQEETQRSKIKAATNSVLNRARETQTVELCFLLDATGSMGPWIDKVKTHINDIVAEVKNVFAKAQVRVACVAYRDFDRKSQSYFEVHDFNINTQALSDFLKKVEPMGGGGNGGEDVNGGLVRVLKLSWQSLTKCIIHLADESCHGKRFSQEKDIEFPDGHPSDIPQEKILRELKSIGVDQYFMHLVDRTKKMTREFQEIWRTCGKLQSNNQRGGFFNSLEMGLSPKDFVQIIKDSILVSIEKSIQSSKYMSHSIPQNVRGRAPPPPDTIVRDDDDQNCMGRRDPNIPSLAVSNASITPIANWNSKDWKFLEGKLQHADLFSSIDKVLKQGIKFLECQCELRQRPQPFAKGTFNLAFPAVLERTGNKIVIKEPINISGNVAAMQELEIKKNGLTVLLSRDFNGLLKKKGKQIEEENKLMKQQGNQMKKMDNFKWARIIFISQCLFQTGQGSYIIEGFMEGDYAKFGNNLNALSTERETRHLTAFQHQSYLATGGKYMVSDFQGIQHQLLTDPVIHSSTSEFKNSGDFGQEGFVEFFSRHTCNEVCKALELQGPPDNMVLNVIPKWIEKRDEHPHNDRIRTKCKCIQCNFEPQKEGAKWCNDCEGLLKEFRMTNCKICGDTFNDIMNQYFMKGLAEPKKCPYCRKGSKKYKFIKPKPNFTDYKCANPNCHQKTQGHKLCSSCFNKIEEKKTVPCNMCGCSFNYKPFKLMMKGLPEFKTCRNCSNKSMPPNPPYPLGPQINPRPHPTINPNITGPKCANPNCYQQTQGHKLCSSCFNKIEEKKTVPCNMCRRPFNYKPFKLMMKGLPEFETCRDCHNNSIHPNPPYPLGPQINPRLHPPINPTPTGPKCANPNCYQQTQGHKLCSSCFNKSKQEKTVPCNMCGCSFNYKPFELMMKGKAEFKTCSDCYNNNKNRRTGQQ